MKILCLPMDKIRPLLEDGRQSYTGEPALQIVELLRGNGVWIERPDAEENPEYRQVIPYVTVENTLTGRRLLMTRMIKQGEARLHGKEYVGVGGHIDQQSENEEPELHCLPDAAHRELAEETGFTHGVLNYLGVICIDGPQASAVDRVHVGIVYEYRTTEEKIISPEADQHNHRWATLDDLRYAYPNAEVWSQCVIRDFLRLI